jgi:hypothetical protein
MPNWIHAFEKCQIGEIQRISRDILTINVQLILKAGGYFFRGVKKAEAPFSLDGTGILSFLITHLLIFFMCSLLSL